MKYPNRRELCSTTVLLAISLPFQLGAQGAFVNGNFETGNLSGWTQGGGYWSGEWPIDPSRYLPGGPNFNSSYYVNSVVGPGPLKDPRTDNNLDVVYSGLKSAQVNNANNNNSVSVISQTVTGYSSPHIYFAWAAVLQASHGPTDSDNFVLQLKDVTTGETLYQVAYNSAQAQTATLFTRSNSNWYYTSWQVQDLNVSTRQGHTFTLTLLASDCPYGGHAGYVYLDGFGAVTPPSGPSSGPLTISGDQNPGTYPVGGRVSGTLSASGGVPPYKWDWIDKAPQGFSLTGGGFSGPAGAPGTYSAGVIVQDSAGSSVVAYIEWSVFGFSSASLPDGIQFSPYSASLGISGGSPPFSFSASGLPPGLSVTSSGTIQGTCLQAGTWSVSISGSDSSGRATSGTFGLRMIPPPPLSVTSNTMPGGVAGTVYSQDLRAAGGAPPYTWSLSSGTLAEGLSLRAGGTVSGIPSRAGNYVLQVRVTDVTGASANGEVRLPISPIPLTVKTPSPLATGVVGVEYPDQLIAAAGGTPPYTFQVTSGTLPTGLTFFPNGSLTGVPTGAPGPYLFEITATDSVGATGTATPGLTIRPNGTELMLSAGSLLFELTAGAARLPLPQQVSVQITRPGTPLPYSIAISPSNANWLSVTSTGIAPGKLAISLTPAALQLPAADTPYAVTVQVQCTNPRLCGGSIQTLEVALRVRIVPPQLSVLSDLVSFATAPDSPFAVTQTLGLQNVGGGSVGLGSVSCAARWCSISGTPGFLPGGPPAELSVTIDPAGLSRGFYRTTISMKTSVGTATVPVTLFVSNSNSMTLQPLGTSYLAQEGGTPVGSPASFLVNVAGSEPVTWTTSVLPGANWLTLTNTSGASTTTSPGSVTYTIEPGVAASLKVGTYYGQIRVTAPNVTNSPLDFMVVLNITPAGGLQRPIPVPGGLLFITAAGAKIPSQTVSVATNSAQPVLYTSASGVDSPWLAVSPASGTATPGKPAASAVSVDTSNLKAGVYYGTVSYEFSGPVRYVNVTLIVVPPGQAVSALQMQPRETTSCKPAQLVVAQTGLLGNFSAPASWPTPVILRLFNDCGDPVPSGQVVATFSNGDPPLLLTLADQKTATYAGTWAPRSTSTQVTISTRASAPGLPVITSELSGAVSPNEAPVLDRNGAMHLYNPLKGAALAPGTLISLTGSSLAGVSANAPSGAPLPGILNGTKVLIGGLPAPVAAVSAKSLTVATPVDLETGKQYQVIVSANGALTIPDNIHIVDVAPGVQASASGFAAVRHANGTTVTATAPAAPGEVITMLAAGLGATDPALPSGAVTPANFAGKLLLPVQVTVDGKPSTVKLAGLQPGAVAVYQIDFTVPLDARDGDLTVELTQNDQVANSVRVPVKRP